MATPPAIVSGACRSGVSELSSLKSIGWNANRIGPSGAAALAAGAAFDSAGDAAVWECAGDSAPQSANIRTAASQLDNSQLFIRSDTKVPLLILLRQFLLSSNGEPSFRLCGGSPRLSPTCTKYVVSRRNQSISSFIHITQVPRLQCELHMPHFAWLDVNARKAAKRTQRCSRKLGEINIQFHNFISCARTRVFHIH